ncbi:MAG: hypothetical protein CFE62_003155 [Candidatus Aquirickettsiella gammari]|uniref:Uncharacterized protein n=1 Tax=Candidatus Aquirickettsiella gammari TaxID=2016198 RepID=A0A370CJM6_9COXI|nr:MAG: hypothetical protein CFE62_003155 [Candidatus Aquirickettsiella gammari]
MPKFSEAFDRFKKDGFFELDTKLYTEQINKLQICARFLREDNPEIPFYQFHLSHVQFVPGYLPRPERVVDGVVVEHHAQRDWHPTVPDVVLLQMARSASAFNMGLRFNELNALEIPSEEQLKSALYSLLNQAGIWSSIKIDWVSFFCDNEAQNYLNADFHNDLLERLTEQAGTSLKELSLKPFSLSNSLTALVNFLTRSVDLEILHLEIIDATRDEWLELARVLAVCPKLKSLNLGNTLFDENAYAALSTLLDENYRIEVIEIAEPNGNLSLRDAYEQLDQRVSKPGQVRFKEERLSLEALLDLALRALVTMKKINREQPIELERKTELMNRFIFLLSAQGARKLTDPEKEAWLEEARVLPDVYPNHKEYMKYYSELVHLHLDEFIAERGKTVGYLLLEKVLETRNVEAMETLLKAKVDLFEMPSDNTEKPFLKRALQGRRYGAIEVALLRHLAWDMSLTELALEYFKAHPELQPIFEKFTNHLCKYADILIYKNDLPGFLAFTKGIINLCRKIFNIKPPSEQRGEEYADSHLKLRKSMRVATANGQEELSRKSVSEMRKIIQEMRDDSFSAARGIFNRAKLHDPMFKFLGELDGKLSEISDKIDDRKDDFIKNILERCAQDKIEAEARLAQELQAAEVRHEQELETVQARLDRMEGYVEHLTNLLRQNGIMNQNPMPEERSGTSTHFFARR